MADETEWELNHQNKILDILKGMKDNLILLRESVSSSANPEEATSRATDATQVLLSQVDLLLEESNYIFELSNCKQIMLSDNIKCIKQLEQEISELKLQIP
jgi:hypothetical protein